jgi:hypothetical protein
MNICKLRVVIDTEEAQDVFRDIEISLESNFEELHRTILGAFAFSGRELASFYESNDSWDKGREIPLMETGSPEEGGAGGTMSSVRIGEVVKSPGDKLLYVYDFLRMWCFMAEVLEVKKASPGKVYPFVTQSIGDAPDEESREIDLFDDFDDDDDEFGSEYDADEFDDEDDEDEMGFRDFEGRGEDDNYY